jgi:tRNA threonylcarbamoyladenosine biosynthesis protein TsaB
MALILNIDTSTAVCSVALAEGGELKGHLEIFENFSHATNLTVLIEKLMAQCQLNFNQLSAIAVSCGPGSYTGLRIGVSTAKGLCYALGIPLIAINSLKILCAGAQQHLALHNQSGINVLFCPMIDARRMEVYTSVFDAQMKELEEVSAKIITESSFGTWLNQSTVYFFGDGAAKCQQTICHPNALFLTDIFPLAKNMCLLSQSAFGAKQFEDVAYFEPFYLKDFVATAPKNKAF